MTETVTDVENNVTLEVSESPNGKTLEISFTRFTKAPVSVTITVPARSSEVALRAFIEDLFVNEDVLVNLLAEARSRM